MHVASVLALLRTTLREALDDDVFSLSAAIAYYTIFSLPALLVLLVGLAGAVFGADSVQEALLGQAEGLVGRQGREAVRAMIANAGDLRSGVGGKMIGVAVLLLGAAGAFGQLQKALNRAWEVEDVDGSLLAFVMKRFLSFGMILTIAFLLLVSLALSAGLALIGDFALGTVPDGVASGIVRIVNSLVSLGIIAALFAVMFKVLPDAEVRWRSVWVGGLVTAVLFTVGKEAISVYIGLADPGSAFGAAGSLALILLWIYYSALIILIGAEFTQVWATREGAGIHPEALGVSDGPHRHPFAEPRDPAPYSSADPS